MVNGRRRRGQGIILILIILFVIVVVFVVLSSRSAQVKSAPVVLEAFWKVGVENVTAARIGDKVEAHLIVEAPEEYVGSIVVKIRKDISLWSDSDYSVKTVPVDLKGGQPTELELEFVADQASEGRLRGYFVEVDFTVKNANWVMENSYPPRLRVNPPVPSSNF